MMRARRVEETPTDSGSADGRLAVGWGAVLVATLLCSRGIVGGRIAIGPEGRSLPQVGRAGRPQDRNRHAIADLRHGRRIQEVAIGARTGGALQVVDGPRHADDLPVGGVAPAWQKQIPRAHRVVRARGVDVDRRGVGHRVVRQVQVVRQIFLRPDGEVVIISHTWCAKVSHSNRDLVVNFWQ